MGSRGGLVPDSATSDAQDVASVLDRAALLKDLKKLVSVLGADLRERSEEVAEFDTALRADYAKAYEAKRTAATYESWREGVVEQAAVAWVLATVFVRFCEDNGLVDSVHLAGPGDRWQLAQDLQQAYFRTHPTHNDRDWIEDGIRQMSANKVARGLFDERHNPMWTITPSTDGAAALLAFWRTRGADGEIVHCFADEEWNTRFLGDLYQDLSEYAKKTYALLQTPDFVEEFILDLTLTPALEEFGLSEEFRLIDPTCGSGHFLLGAFERLLEAWREQASGVNDWTLIHRALASVHGVDKNPFAASIARFRLLVAAMKAGEIKTLAEAPEFPTVVAVGDSLLAGRDAPGVQGVLFGGGGTYSFSYEDVDEYVEKYDVLGRSSYHVVVGNPPYITVKDKQENENYRVYSACAGAYPLSIPFAQRFFHLAISAGGQDRRAGFVGQITANSFMKREFGKRLIESFFPTVELTHIIDSAGAYVPGHGTPTVILVGRARLAFAESGIRTVLGARSEPSQPVDPRDGVVWRAILAQIGIPGSDSEWISVEDSDRSRFASHPWSVSGGGAGYLLSQIQRQPNALAKVVRSIGRTTHTGLDDAFYLTDSAVETKSLSDFSAPVVLGEDVRDYEITPSLATWFPYDGEGSSRPIGQLEERFAWPNRSLLRERVDFGQKPEDRGLRWFDHSMFFADRFRSKFSVAFAFVATHNHFVLDRGDKVFKQTAPVVKLPEGSTEGDHQRLLGVLNSSLAGWWLRQVSYRKAGALQGGGISDQPWSWIYEFTGTKLHEFPLPAELPLTYGKALDTLAQHLQSVEPSAICGASTPIRKNLDAARAEYSRTRTRMIALQEELDWDTYRLYNLISATQAATLVAPDHTTVPEIQLGERAFEIVLAQKMVAGELETQWFARHGSTPITEIPAHWPADYRAIVQARIDVIENRRDVALIERPECKRRWASDSWETKEAAALKSWLLDRTETRSLWLTNRDGVDEPRLLTVNQLADELRGDADFVSVAALYASAHLGKHDADLADIVKTLVEGEHVPFLAALRYKDTGLRKRATWERCWELQREEDATGKRLNIPVPDKYSSADFLKTSYWRNRGKLDVPKERFISYPDANPDGDNSLLLGWAGFDHRQQALALAELAIDRADNQGWGRERMIPILAGLAEVMPWVWQWHAGYDDVLGGDPAEAYQAQLEAEMTKHGITTTDLTSWRPAAKAARGRKPKQ